MNDQLNMFNLRIYSGMIIYRNGMLENIVCVHVNIASHSPCLVDNISCIFNSIVVHHIYVSYIL